jgi:xylulokinase
MTSSELLLGIDIGTTRVKALLADAAGRVVGAGVADTPFETIGTHVEMTLEAFQGAVATAVRSLGDGVGQVAAVGIASMGETGVPLDRAGRASGPLVAWHDPRGARVVRRLVEAFGEELEARAGQATRAQSSIAKIGWFVQHGAEVARWLGAAETVLWTLTGEETTEASLACRTGAFDVRQRTFIREVIETVGGSGDVFPAVRAAGDPHGRVSATGAAWLRVPSGIPVTVAGHDHMVGAAGVGLTRSDLLDSIGTAETLVRYADDDLDPGTAVDVGADVSIDPAAGRLALMAGDLRPGRIVEAARQKLGDASFAELDGPGPGQALEALHDPMAGAGTANDGDAFLEQLRSNEPEAASAGPARVRWRGLIEAMSAYMWRCAEGIEPLTGPPARIVLIGGGARSDTWAAAKRRLAGRPVVRSRLEATAYGAALFAGAALGAWATLADAPRHPLEPIEG